MAALVGLLSEKPAGAATDAEIRDQILEEIDRQPWGPRDGIDVIVTNAENVPGVKAVHDRLVWIDSVSGIVIPRP
jgi:hypothetical protein